MFKPAAILALTLVSLSACGYQPVLATRSNQGVEVSQALRAVEIATIDDRSGQMLRNHLIDRMHKQGALPASEGTLRVRLEEREIVVGRDSTDATTRAQLAISADWALVRDGETRMRATSRGIAGYNLPEAQYAARVDEQDARARALEELADDIATRLSLYLASPNQMPQ